MEYIQLVILWIVYFFVHSLFAADRTKVFVQQIIPNYFHLYRLAYSSISILTLLPILYFIRLLPNINLFQGNSYVIIWGSISIIISILIGYKALSGYKTSDFLGLEQLKKNEPTSSQLNTSGLNQYVRHPLYFAALFFIWGAWLMYPTIALLVTNSIVCCYLIVGTKLEEQKLINEFGNAYKAYQNNVSMLIPIKLKKSS